MALIVIAGGRTPPHMIILVTYDTPKENDLRMAKWPILSHSDDISLNSRYVGIPRTTLSCLQIRQMRQDLLLPVGNVISSTNAVKTHFREEIHIF